MSEQQTTPQKQPLNEPTKPFFKPLRMHTLRHCTRRFERLMSHDKFSSGATSSSQIMKAQQCLPWQRWWQSPWRFSAQLPRVPCAWPAPPGAGNAIPTQGQPCRAWTCNTHHQSWGALAASCHPFPHHSLIKLMRGVIKAPPALAIPQGLLSPAQQGLLGLRQSLDNWGSTTHEEVFFIFDWLFASQPAVPCNEITAQG